MRPMLDVDFGFLGNSGGTRGGFGNLGWGPLTAPTTVPATPVATPGPTAPTATPWLDALLNVGTTVAVGLSTKPARPPNQVTIVQGGSGLPSWALPAAGLAVAGGLAYMLFKKRR